MVLAPILGVALWLRLSRWVTFALGSGTVLFFVVLTAVADPAVHPSEDGTAALCCRCASVCSCDEEADVVPLSGSRTAGGRR